MEIFLILFFNFLKIKQTNKQIMDIVQNSFLLNIPKEIFNHHISVYFSHKNFKVLRLVCKTLHLYVQEVFKPIRKEFDFNVNTQINNSLPPIQFYQCAFSTDNNYPFNFLTSIYCQNLKILTIRGFINKEFNHIPSTLTYLNLAGCKNIGDEGLKCLTSSNIIDLDLYGSDITDKGLIYLPKKLNCLDLSFCVISSEGLKHLPSTLTILTIISLSDNRVIIDDEGLKYLPSNLIYLNLSDGDITDEGLKYFPSKLKTLNLRKCKSLNGKGLKYLSSTLTDLNLSSCENITDEGLKYLPSNLITLDLAFCKSLNGKGLKYLPSNLTDLDLAFCENITDEGLKYLPSNLTKLNLSSCHNISDEGCLYLPKKIKNLNISGCKKIKCLKE
jgi:hypothetical protein